MKKPQADEFPDRSRGEIWVRHKCPCCNRCWINQYGKCPYGGPFRGYEAAK